MAEVFAGFVVGFALSIIVAPAAAIALIRSNHQTGIAQRIAPDGTNIAALTMFIHFLAFLILTALGLVLGMALAGIEERRPQGGLGSPNLVYTFLVLALALAIVTPLMLVQWRRFALVICIVSAALFGWAVPWLALAAS